MGKTGRYHILFFEPEVGGHHLDYIRHLCFYLARKGDLQTRVSFVVHPEFNQCASDLVKNVTDRSEHRITFLNLATSEYQSCIRGPLVAQSFSKWGLMQKYLMLTGADHAHFMHLDHLQLPLALQRRPLNGATVSGILFLPSIHYAHYWKTETTMMEKLINMRKRILYMGMLLNPALHTVFSLDPYFAEYADRHLPHGRKVCALPDPALYPQTASVPDKSMPGYIQNIPDNRKTFLLFGRLERRKGIFKVLQAFDYLDDNILREVAIVFAGRSGREIRDEFHRKYEEASSRFKRVWLHLEDRFIPDDELVRIVQRSDVILTPYHRFTGSSGVLLWAAGAGKPVIAQDYGLMGALAREFGLGLAVDSRNPKEIAKAIEHYVGNEREIICDKSKMASFVKGNTSGAFAHTILSKILDEV